MNAPKKSRTLVRDKETGDYLLQEQPYKLNYYPDKKAKSTSKYSPKECKKEGKR